MKKAFAAALTLLLVAGCAPATQAAPSAGAPAAQTPSEAPKPPDLQGLWKQTNSKASDTWQEAKISGNTIEVHFIGDNGDTKSLYWAGTFVAPTAPGASYGWESKNDKSKTGGSVVGSPSDTKTFSFADGALSWDVTMMGTTVRVKAERK